MEDLIVDDSEGTYCQPCISIWDTCLATSTLAESGIPTDDGNISKAVDWLMRRQVFVDGDWSVHARKLKPGGGAFNMKTINILM